VIHKVSKEEKWSHELIKGAEQRNFTVPCLLSCHVAEKCQRLVSDDMADRSSFSHHH